MKLKHIYITPCYDEYSPELVSDFLFQTRYVCNYIERHIKPLKFNADGFSRIIIEGRRLPKSGCRVVPEKALSVEIPFDQEKYEGLQEDELHEFFLLMLEAGFRQCEESCKIPSAELLSITESFRREGYINHWTHKKKQLRGLGLTASLECELDINEFRLFLRIQKKGKLVFDECILRTKPDEIIFEHQFKDVKVAEDKLLVIDKFDNTIFNRPMADLRDMNR